MPSVTITSDDSWQVPIGVGEVDVTLSGEAGRDGDTGGFGNNTTSAGSDGLEVTATMSVSGGQTLYIRFGGGGIGTYESDPSYNAYAEGGDGGDAADIRKGGTALSDRAIVAPGGGGGSAATFSDETPQAWDSGAAGWVSGEDGGVRDTFFESAVARGGDRNSGGSGGNLATDGSAGQGGQGMGNFDQSNAQSGGGGGGGYYGGGGGGADSVIVAGGAGGSGYSDASVSSVSYSATPTTNSFVEISYELPPDAATDLAATADSGDEITLSWTFASSADEYNVYRSTDPGVSKSDTLAGTATSDPFTDTGLNDGSKYHYAVAGVNSVGEGELSNEAGATTTLPAPTDLSVVDVGADEVDLSWTANHDNGETRVEISEDDDGTWSVAQTVPYNTESATVSGLLNGQLYGVRVVADTGDAEEVDQ